MIVERPHTPGWLADADAFVEAEAVSVFWHLARAPRLLRVEWDGAGNLTFTFNRAAKWIGGASTMDFFDITADRWTNTGGPSSGNTTTTLVFPMTHIDTGVPPVLVVSIVAGAFQGLLSPAMLTPALVRFPVDFS
jgi:hypothetical protein